MKVSKMNLSIYISILTFRLVTSLFFLRRHTHIAPLEHSSSQAEAGSVFPIFYTHNDDPLYFGLSALNVNA
jgi:hypothetical protein